MAIGFKKKISVVTMCTIIGLIIAIITLIVLLVDFFESRDDQITITYILEDGRRLEGLEGSPRRHADIVSWDSTIPLRIASGREGYHFYRWWTQYESTVINDMDDVRRFLAHRGSNQIYLVADWMPTYIYRIRFWLNDGTDRYLYRAFNHSDVHTPLSAFHLFYFETDDGELIPNENILQRPGLRRMAWTNMPRTIQEPPFVAVHSSNQLIPGRTIAELLLDPLFISDRDGNNFYIDVYAAWYRIPD